MGAGPILIVAAVGAAGALGWSPPPEVAAKLARGEAYAEVSAQADGSAGVVRGAIDIDAPAAVIWKVMLDCGRAARMVPSVISCKVVEQGSGGRWDVREHRVRWSRFLPPLRSVFRSDYTPMKRIAFRCTGGDLKACEGEWRLEPLPNGEVRVIYENRAEAPFAAPNALFRSAMRRDIPEALLALRRESLSAK